MQPLRIAYPPQVEAEFGINKQAWRAIAEAIFPTAQTADSIILALAYCKGRNLDVMKRVVHIVPIYDKTRGRMVETVWPGIAELRTTAFRTKSYAGRDATEFGPTITSEWDGRNGAISVDHPEWAQVTLYRMVHGHRVPFVGPRVYWRESYATMGKTDEPNSMWQKRPFGQHDKCAEAAALRSAFPEELGDELTAEEVRLISDIHNKGARTVETTAHPVLQAIAPTPEPVEEETAPEKEETYEEASKRMIQERGGTALFDDDGPETDYDNQD
jgi:phage recombination protein Bet